MPALRKVDFSTLPSGKLTFCRADWTVYPDLRAYFSGDQRSITSVPDIGTKLPVKIRVTEAAENGFPGEIRYAELPAVARVNHPWERDTYSCETQRGGYQECPAVFCKLEGVDAVPKLNNQTVYVVLDWLDVPKPIRTQSPKAQETNKGHIFDLPQMKRFKERLFPPDTNEKVIEHVALRLEFYFLARLWCEGQGRKFDDPSQLPNQMWETVSKVPVLEEIYNTWRLDHINN